MWKKQLSAPALLAVILLTSWGTPSLPAQGLDTVPWWDELFEVKDADLTRRLMAHGSWLARDRVTCSGATCTVELDRFTELPGGAGTVCSDVDVFALPQSRGFGGVLVGEDLFLTVHGLGINACLNRQVVFGFAADSALSPLLSTLEPGGTLDFPVPSADVYDCIEVLGGGSTVGWTLIRLDRPVSGRQPVKLQRFGYPEPSVAVVNAGYPARLPLKVETATLTASTALGGSSDAHVLGGSSGSAVFAPSGRTLGVVATGLTGWWIADPFTGCFRPDPDANSRANFDRPVDTDLDLVPALGLEVSHDAADSETGLVIDHYGPQGGPFTNESVIYRVEAGAGGPAVDWSFIHYDLIEIIEIPVPPTDFHLKPGEFVEVEARADFAASFLPIGLWPDLVSFGDRTLATLDTVHHRIHIGVDGFDLECVPPPGAGRCDLDFLGEGPSGALVGESATYRLTNRWDVDHSIDVVVPPWLEVVGPAGPAGDPPQVVIPPRRGIDVTLTVVADGSAGTAQAPVAFVSNHRGVENSRREILARADLGRIVIEDEPGLVILPGDSLEVLLWANRLAGTVDDVDFCLRISAEPGPIPAGDPPALALSGPGGVLVDLGMALGRVCWSDEVFDPPPRVEVRETPALTAFEEGPVGGSWSLFIDADPKATWKQLTLRSTSLRPRIR